MVGSLSYRDCSIQSGVAPSLGLNIVSFLASNLPDSVSRQPPVLNDEAGQRLDETIVHVTGDCYAMSRREVDGV